MPWPRGRRLTAEHKAKVAAAARAFAAANPEWRRARAEKQRKTWDPLRRKRQANNLADTQARLCRKFERNRMAALADWLSSPENAEQLRRQRRLPGFEEKRAAAQRAKYPPLPQMSAEDKRLYRKLRRCGLRRDQALSAWGKT